LVASEVKLEYGRECARAVRDPSVLGALVNVTIAHVLGVRAVSEPRPRKSQRERANATAPNPLREQALRESRSRRRFH